MTHYEASVVRDGRFWLITVHADGARFGLTQARTLAEVEPMTRDLIATVLDADDPAVFDVSFVYAPEISGMVQRVEQARLQARAARDAADGEARAAARALLDAGVSTRDAAVLLHVSPGWVSVLAREAA